MTASAPEGAAEGFGRELRRLRQRARMTQADVARALEVQRATLSQWETGRHLPAQENVVQLDRLLDGRGGLIEAAGSVRDPGDSGPGSGRRISLREVNDRMGRVLVDHLVVEEGVPKGWGREFNEPVSLFSTVSAIRLLCLLDNPPYIDLHALANVVRGFHISGGWTTRRVGVRPETTATAVDALARLGAPDLDVHLDELEALMDNRARTSTYVLAEVLGPVARLRPQSDFCARLVRDLLDARRPTRRALWPEKTPAMAGVVPRPSTAHTARAVTALLLAVEAGVDDNGEIAEAVEIGATWLAAESDLRPVRENLEPVADDGRTRDLEIRHFTPALVARAYSLVPEPPWPAVQAALDRVWGQYNDTIARWTWANGDVPVWMQYDAVAAVRALAERTTFVTLPDQDPEDPDT